MRRPIRPQWFTPEDLRWLAPLVAVVHTLEGRRRSAVERGLAEAPVDGAPPWKLRVIKDLLLRKLRERPVGNPPPRVVREALYRAAAGLPADSPPRGTVPHRRLVVAEALRTLRDEAVPVDDAACLAVVTGMFDDIPAERVVVGLADGVTPDSLLAAGNAALVAGYVQRAVAVVVSVPGDCRGLLRQVKLAGLLATAYGDGAGVRLEISGPLSLLRRTKLYGRAVLRLLPALATLPAFELLLTCEGRSGPYDVVIRGGDPLPQEAAEPHATGRMLAQLAEDVERGARPWRLMRDPAPLEAVDGTGRRRLHFPDALLVPADDARAAAAGGATGTSGWWVEVVGFWSPAYLAAKLDHLRAAGLEQVVLCLDERNAVEPGALPAGARVVKYRSRISAADLLALVEGP